MRAIARSCSKKQRTGDLCTVIAANYRDVNTRDVFLATVVVRNCFASAGYCLHDLAYASRRIQQTQSVGMAKLNNAAKRSRTTLTDITEVMTFKKR